MVSFLRSLRKGATSSILTHPKRARQAAPLRGQQRVLADALDQLRAGVPLNWSQLEDDPELAILSALQSAAAECRDSGRQPPAELRSTLLAQLTAQLPAPKPEPVKVAPKQPAGVSESVYIPPQAEENVPLTSPVLRWVGVGVAALLLIVWVASTFSGAMRGGLSFAWVEVRQADKTISTVDRPANWQPLQCAATGASGVNGLSFLTLIDPGQIDASAGQIAVLLPYRLTSPVSYTLGLLNGAVAPCADVIPDRSDLGAVLKLSYVSSFRKFGTDYDITPFTVFQFKSQPFTLDVGDGAWEAVSVGDWRGVYWRGDAYRDLEGTSWTNDVSVLAVERSDLVMVVVGQNNQGITKEMLLAVLKHMEQARKSEAERFMPSFAWVELVKGAEVLSPRRQSADLQSAGCADFTGTRTTRSFRRNFIRLDSLEAADPYVGFPILSLNLEGAGVLSYTARILQPSVGPCTPGSLELNDPLAVVKLGYAVNVASAYARPEMRFTLYESKARPVKFDVGSGSWEAIQDSDAQMLYWTGNPYRDPEGIEWNITTNVLLVEKGDYTLTLVGFPELGAGKEALLVFTRLIE